MQLTLALIKSPQQMLLRHFGPDSSDEKGKIVDIMDLEQLSFDALFIDDNAMEDLAGHDQWENLQSMIKYSPIRQTQELGINLESFEALNYSQARALWEKTSAPWALANNLKLLENLFQYLDHLNQFWPNQRSNFFEELWFVLKSNLGALELSLIYNDLKKAKNENEKNKLIQVCISGERKPNPIEDNEVYNQLFKDYEKHFSDRLHIIEWNKEKGELVFTFSIYQGPVLAMAKTTHFGPFQKSLLTALIDGLNRDKIVH